MPIGPHLTPGFTNPSRASLLRSSFKPLSRQTLRLGLGIGLPAVTARVSISRGTKWADRVLPAEGQNLGMPLLDPQLAGCSDAASELMRESVPPWYISICVLPNGLTGLSPIEIFGSCVLPRRTERGFASFHTDFSVLARGLRARCPIENWQFTRLVAPIKADPPLCGFLAAPNACCERDCQAAIV